MSSRLKNSKSTYLRSISHEPVEWYEWSEEAFKKAKEEDKPILLSIGAVWCHWCHVMSEECFNNTEIAKIINEDFVPIKVDRDERPDIDRRYQEAVSIISGSGGWPLTAFLTPDGDVFFGGTYFPPEDGYGRPGFKSILKVVIKLYKENKKRIIDASQELFNKISVNEKTERNFLPDEKFLKNITKKIITHIDKINGGFGTRPKFYFASTLEFLLDMYIIESSDDLKIPLMTTLDKISMGGVYDHLGGGFFRYSTDERWMIPHFEKMLYDNAIMLRLYTKAWRRFRKDLYLDTVNGILRYYKKYGSDGNGGFYSSQDADIGHLDEGGYYTFLIDEIRNILSPEEFEITRLYFNLDDEKSKHEGLKNIIYITKSPEEISVIKGISIDEVKRIINSAKIKMLLYREKREMPFIDKTIYTDSNGIMIESLSISGRLLKNKDMINMAEMAARRIIREYYRNGSLMHSSNTVGFADDYIFFAKGLIELYQVTGNDEYLKKAINLTDAAVKLFSDNGGLLYDTEDIKEEGYLRIRRKIVEDNPVQSSNGVAPTLLMNLYYLTENKSYMEVAINILKESIPYIETYPIYMGSALRSLLAYYEGIRKIETRDYLEDALYDLYPFNLVIRKNIDGTFICHREQCIKFPDYPFFFQ